MYEYTVQKERALLKSTFNKRERLNILTFIETQCSKKSYGICKYIKAKLFTYNGKDYLAKVWDDETWVVPIHLHYHGDLSPGMVTLGPRLSIGGAPLCTFYISYIT